MKHLYLLFLIIIISLQPVNAQIDLDFEYGADSLLIMEASEVLGFSEADTIFGWNFHGIIGADFGQKGVSNWVSGGGNSVSYDAYTNISLLYFNKKISWDNYLYLNYGTIYSSNRNWQKAADRIVVSSLLAYHTKKKWSYTGLIDFNSQFNKGYLNNDSKRYKTDIFAPAYSHLAFGASYKSNKRFAYFVAPITLRTTFCFNNFLSDRGAFGVTPGKKFLFEPGIYASISTSQHFVNNIDLVSKIDFFTPYNQNIGNVDINWDILMIFKIYKLFTFTLNASIRYYGDEIAKIQARDVLGAGISYTF